MSAPVKGRLVGPEDAGAAAAADVAGGVPVKGSAVLGDGPVELATTTGGTTQVGSFIVWGTTQSDGVDPAAPAAPPDRSTTEAPITATTTVRLVQAVTRMPTL